MEKSKEKNLLKNSGITLIALVITVIVLLILAGVAIATLTGDNGLLTKANEAKNSNAEAVAIEKIQVEIIGSYSKNGKIDIENQLNQNLQRINGLKYNGEALSDTNKINKLPSEVELDGHLYVIQEDGNVEKLIWVQDKTYVTNTQTGKTYEVGDIVDYDCGVAEYTGQWGILGVENGSLLLMSTTNVTNVTLNGKKDYLTDGTIKLNNACAPYKNELYAIKARSVKVEDINRVNGYQEPATKEYTYTMVDGHVKRNDQTNPSSQTKFEDIDGKKLPDDVQISIIEDTYSYKFLSNIPSESKAYNLITDKIDNSYAFYWLDNKYVGSYAGDVRWGFRSVIYDGAGGIDNSALYFTYWGDSATTRGARAVVILKSGVQLSENVNSNGVYEIH